MYSINSNLNSNYFIGNSTNIYDRCAPSTYTYKNTTQLWEWSDIYKECIISIHDMYL
jgi:hypothetical protein